MGMSGGEDGRSIEWDEGERDIMANSKKNNNQRFTSCSQEIRNCKYKSMRIRISSCQVSCEVEV